MAKKNKLVQAYRQAPWRSQLQYAGFVLLALVGMVLVAGVYLFISGETAAAGVQIQNLDFEKQNTQREIADLESRLAFLTSAEHMERRAKEMGFEPIRQEQLSYIPVSQYPGRQPVILAPPPGANVKPHAVIKEAYTQSLWEWMVEDLFPGGLPLQEARK